MARTKKNDFIELEFTGKIKDTGEIFDTNIAEDAKKMGEGIEVKSLIVCIGQGMVIKGLDKELEGREINKKYMIELSPDKAFGQRDPKLIRLFSLNTFREKNVNPKPGMVFALDNMLVRIISVSGGRVLVDFNNPLAGKTIVYEFRIKKKITDEKEKVNALMNFFFKKRFDFEIKDNKIIIKDRKAEGFVKLFGKRFKEILGLELSL